MSKNRYEYKRIIVSGYRVEKELNEWADLGYRAINVYSDKNSGDYFILLERQYSIRFGYEHWLK